MKIVVPAVLGEKAGSTSGPDIKRDQHRALTTVAVLSNSWPAMQVMADEMAEYLEAHEGVRVVTRGSYPTSQEASVVDLREMAGDAELAILGVAT